ncbi:MAG: hypothetical protein K0R39_4971 [Symbiobacteriaceae bacterium]|jgi:uncharacterized membrane protein YpjA|nr:hypothetical protein [Symbiobacteriaceae bacterium]
MTLLRNFFATVARERRWWWVLLGINFFGSLYGFYWYKGQLAATPIKYWLIVPDSPGSTFLLCIWLMLMLAGADWRKPGMQWLGAIAFVSNMKYGLWTATVLPQAGFKFGWDFDFIHLSLSHAGMWVQAMIFARFYKPALAPAVGALLFMYFQDLIDYFVLGTHPTLPYQSEFAYARGMAILLSTLWGFFLVWQAWFDRKEKRA